MDLDPDRILALSYVPAKRRAAVGALWRLDAAMGAVLAAGGEPMISRIKLAWWREALEKLDHAPPPAEPVLQDLADHVLPAGVRGAELARMEEGWAELLSPDPLTAEAMDFYAQKRGGLLFRFSARLLGGAEIEGGEAWALTDLARHSADFAEREAALTAARSYAVGPVPAHLRPLGMLAVLARRDSERGRSLLERQGSPARMWRMLRHRLTGL